MITVLFICFFLIPLIILLVKIFALKNDIKTLREEVDVLRKHFGKEVSDLRKHLGKEVGDLRKHLGIEISELRKHLGPLESVIKSPDSCNPSADQPEPQLQKIPTQAPVQEREQPLPEHIAIQAKTIHTPQAAPAAPGPSYFTNMTAGKAFSWIGGLLLLLGVVFAIKYSIENDFISAQMRIICGTVLGLALVAASFFIKADEFKVTADTLCASGLAVLYGITFSAAYFYDFLSPMTAFFMMGGVSLASFWLASHRKARYIGYIGIVTGFLTPIILNTGSQNYLVLFTYLAFINAGAMGAGIKEGWDKLVFTALGFTLLFQLVWFYPAFNPLKITDFCIIFAAYTAAAAAVVWFCREKLSEDVRLSFGLYIAGSFLFVFLTDLSLPAIGLALFINLLLAALFFGEAQVYNIPFKIVNIAAFLLLASWLGSVDGKGQSGILLLTTSLVFTALNVIVSMARNVKEDIFTAALPVAALLLLFFMPDTDLWILYAFGLIFTAAAMTAAFRANNEFIACVALVFFAAFLLRGIFLPWQSFGFFELVAGLLCAIGLLCALNFGGFLPGKNRNISIAAGIMPYVFLTAFILKNQPQEMQGLIFCAGISAVILAVSCLNKNNYYPLIAAAGAFLPQIITAGGPAGLSEYTALYVIIWAFFFACPFVIRDEGLLSWSASALAGVTLLVTSLINHGYINVMVVSAFIAIVYGAAAFFTGGNAAKQEVERKTIFAALAWIALFIFINAQIAYFYTPGDKLVFGTGGNLAKTVAYTLAWGIYGMLTLFASIGIGNRYGAFVGIGLVVTALIKLFLSDVWMLSTAYRVVIFIGMAVILIAGSFFYQALTEMLKKNRE